MQKKHVWREGWRASGYLVDLSETAPHMYDHRENLQRGENWKTNAESVYAAT